MVEHSSYTRTVVGSSPTVPTVSRSSNPETPEMNAGELLEFLSRPYLMDLSTVTADGYPHVTPVWFDWDGEAFLASTTRERRKARNIARNPKVGFSIADHNLPYPAVVGSGEATMSDDPMGELLHRLARRYLPPDQADSYFAELMQAGGSRIILRIKPTWMLSWTGE